MAGLQDVLAALGGQTPSGPTTLTGKMMDPMGGGVPRQNPWLTSGAQGAPSVPPGATAPPTSPSSPGAPPSWLQGMNMPQLPSWLTDLFNSMRAWRGGQGGFPFGGQGPFGGMRPPGAPGTPGGTTPQPAPFNPGTAANGYQDASWFNGQGNGVGNGTVPGVGTGTPPALGGSSNPWMGGGGNTQTSSSSTNISATGGPTSPTAPTAPTAPTMPTMPSSTNIQSSVFGGGAGAKKKFGGVFS